eukprot:CAMPEP_0204584410 /NCGR_PEP_ID=MMETSP0661-20131031/46322_1 /ASSEMBLY_ACC=CAM_ASM_000606 /TAXON_ID=109239 /ORGANISM="Alexandrium margalefi, Strain AMGDE01CS-322" /LENGTH=55 /DNA_ID=CAMNT_0051593851 /DNA_START=39 /DNA_END=202 /DNA_ORIENTATION=+
MTKAHSRGSQHVPRGALQEGRARRKRACVPACRGDGVASCTLPRRARSRRRHALT